MSITARSTKAELLAHIAVLEVEQRATALLLADLRLQLSIAKAQPAAPAPVAAPRAERVLPAHLAAAREEAMRTGCTVRATPAQGPRTSRVVEPRAPRQLPARFIAAREAAMRLGRSVVVGA